MHMSEKESGLNYILEEYMGFATPKGKGLIIDETQGSPEMPKRRGKSVC